MRKQMSLKIIFKRNYSIFVAVIFLILLFIELITIFSFLEYLKANHIKRSRFIAESLSTAVSFKSVEDIEEVMELLDFEKSIESIVVLDSDGVELARKGSVYDSIVALEEGVGVFGVTSSIISMGENVGTLYIRFIPDVMFEKVAFDFGLFFFLLAAFALFAYQSSRSMVRLVVEPIVALTDIVRMIALSNDLDHKIRTDDFSQFQEVYTLSSQFNEMLKSMQLGRLEVEKSKDQLEKVNRNLEKIVEAKTSKLNDTIDNLKAYQDKLISQEKLASMGTLAAGIAHEIKNPLNLINNSAGVIDEFVKQDLPEYIVKIKNGVIEGNHNYFDQDVETVVKACSMIVKNGNRADSIIKSLLAQSRSETPSFELVELKDLVDEYFYLTFHSMRSTMSMEVKTNITLDDVGEMYIIPQDIGRALTNILGNSYYSMHKRLETEGGQYCPEVTVVLAKKGESHVSIIITDNGIGFNEKIKGRLFEPFYTTKPTGDGTGLGLSMVFDIVRAHQGEILVASEENSFAKFEIILPVNRSGGDV